MINITDKLHNQFSKQLWLKLRLESSESSFQFYSPLNIQLFNKLYLLPHDQLINFPK